MNETPPEQIAENDQADVDIEVNTSLEHLPNRFSILAIQGLHRIFRSPLGWLAITAALFAVLSIVWAVNSTVRQPDFYRLRLAVAADRSEKQGRILERRLANAYNQVNRGASWATLLTEAQINGWLASDLPEKFPDVLEARILEPRLQLSNDEFQLAFQLAGNAPSKSRRVILVSGNIFATGQRNQIAFQIHKMNCGVFPVPFSWWADQLSDTLADRNIILDWTEQHGDAVALITLPGIHVVDAVQIADQSIGLSGHTTGRTTGQDTETNRQVERSLPDQPQGSSESSDSIEVAESQDKTQH